MELSEEEVLKKQIELENIAKAKAATQSQSQPQISKPTHQLLEFTR